MTLADELYQNFLSLANLRVSQGIIIILLLTTGFLLRFLFLKGVLFLVQRKAFSKNDSVKQNYIIPLLKPVSLTFVIAAFYGAGIIANLPPLLFKFYQSVLKTVTTFTFFWALYVLSATLSHLSRSSTSTRGPLNEEVKDFLARSLQILIVALATLSILQIWGMNVMAFLTGLGLFGMAVAFAAQETIKNFFGCISILMDHTFKKGDWIKTSDVEGTVEHIGFRTTTIRQLDKALAHIPNSRLSDNAVINFTKMTNRLIEWTLHLDYTTPSDTLNRISKRIRDFVSQNPDLENDPYHAPPIINLDEFGQASIDLYCCFFTKALAKVEYKQIKENCLLAIKKIVEEEGGVFALPKHNIELAPAIKEDKVIPLSVKNG